MMLPDTVTLEEAGALALSIDSMLQPGADGGLLLDASALRTYDSAAIALLLQARRAAEQRRQSLRISGVPDKLLQLARLYGVDDLLAEGHAGAATADASDAAQPQVVT